MLVVQPGGVLRDRIVADLPQWLEPGDQLVVNDTKVIAAQLKGRRIGRETEPKIEATLIKRLDGSRWQALVKPAKKLARGRRASVSAMRAGCACSAISMPRSRPRASDGEVTLSFSFHGPTLDQAIADLGSPPLPPYIASKRTPDERDAADYQTMFAAKEGAVAAPTAGLHFTPALEAALRARGVGIHRLTLHVGAGTFLPVKVDDTDGHKMHAEWGSISAETAAALNAARAKGGRIVAVGTTSLRLLESAARRGRHHPAVRGRDLDLHHARLSLPRGRYPADQFPSAALDAVHAGLGVLRPRHDEAGLCARDRGGLPVLFVWRCVPVVSRARDNPRVPNAVQREAVPTTRDLTLMAPDHAAASLRAAQHPGTGLPSRHRALRQQLRDLHRVQRGALEQLIGGDEHRDRMAGGIAEILADAADQHVVLARGIDRHREIIFRAIVDDPHARRLRQDRRAPRPRVIGFSHSKVIASQCARSTGTRTQVTPTAIRLVLEDLPRLLDDLGLLVVVAGLGIDRGVVAEQVEGVGVRHHLRRDRPRPSR